MAEKVYRAVRPMHDHLTYRYVTLYNRQNTVFSLTGGLFVTFFQTASGTSDGVYSFQHYTLGLATSCLIIKCNVNDLNYLVRKMVLLKSHNIFT